MSEPDQAILVMGSIHNVLKAEKVLKAEGIAVDTLVTPREISSDCGMVVALENDALDQALACLTRSGLHPLASWRREDGALKKIAAPPVQEDSRG